MDSGQVVHIMLEYDEAVRAKRGILSTEMNVLKILKTIGRYRFLRMEELKLKNRMNLKMKEAKANLKKLQAILPEPKIPRILKKEHHLMEEKIKKAEKAAMATNEESDSGNDIESQLNEIQRRLDRLQGENI